MLREWVSQVLSDKDAEKWEVTFPEAQETDDEQLCVLKWEDTNYSFSTSGSKSKMLVSSNLLLSIG